MTSSHFMTSVMLGMRASHRACYPPVLAFLLAPGLALAQAAPALSLPHYDIGDALKEAQPPRPVPPAHAPAPQIVSPVERPLSLPAGQTLFVREFRLEGTELIADSELQALLAPYQGRELTLAQIQEAAGQVTSLYRSHGYPVARAYVPRQDASDGVLRMQVLVGRYGQFTLNNQSPVDDGVISRVFAPLAASEAPVERVGLERAMLLVGDMPGAQLPKLTIAAGQAPGTSDISVDVPAGRRVGGYLLADNGGSRYTGKNRLSAGVEVNSPFGMADKLAFDGMATAHGRLLNGRLAYAFPLAANGLRAELAAGHTTYELGADYKDLDATGKANTVEGTLSYPLLRSRERSLYLSFNLAAKRLRDEIGAAALVNAKTATVGTLGLRYEAWSGWLGRSAYGSLAGGISYGHLSLDEAQRALNRAGANTQGRYARLNLALTTSLALTQNWSATATLSAQKALLGKNLDSSEQMSISGGRGVKAYGETVSGDNAYLLNLELRAALPAVQAAPGLGHSVGLFADAGRAYLQNGAYALSNGVSLSDVGLGYYLNYKALTGRLQLARATGPRIAGHDGRTRLLVSLGMFF